MKGRSSRLNSLFPDKPGVPAQLWIDRGWSSPPPLQAKQLVQVMGVKGAGKTSHLKHWQAETGGSYCYYPPGWGRVKVPTVEKIAYWDEANRIPLPFLIVALARAALTHATIVAGTHRDLGRVARLLGLRVQTIHLPPLDAEALIVWTKCRIEAVRLPHRDCCLILSRERAQEIVGLAGNSWRDAADRLHIWAAETAGKRIYTKLPPKSPNVGGLGDSIL